MVLGISIIIRKPEKQQLSIGNEKTMPAQGET
jgi:hypothetical protein